MRGTARPSRQQGHPPTCLPNRQLTRPVTDDARQGGVPRSGPALDQWAPRKRPCVPRATRQAAPDLGTRSSTKEVPVTEPRTTAKTDPTGKPDSAAEAVAAAIGRLGSDGAGATAADLAAAAGVAYSTMNKKLRALKDAGRAESFDGPDKRTMWRLPAASRATAGSASEAAAGETDPAAAPPPAPVEQPAEDAIADTAAASTPAGVLGPDVEPDGQPGDAEPDDAPGDPSATVERSEERRVGK